MGAPEGGGGTEAVLVGCLEPKNGRFDQRRTCSWLLNGNFQKDVLRRWAEAVIQLGQWREYQDQRETLG